MIVSFFNHGKGSSSGPINYVLSEKDSNNKVRNPPPELISGDPDMTAMCIDMTKRAHKYTSAVIAFRDSEKPTPEQRSEILKSFRESYFAGLKEDQYSMIVVEHKDKGNVEWHIIIANTELSTGRQLNICPPGKFSKQFSRDWQAYWNDRLGYEQVVEDPLKAHLSKFDHLAQKFEKGVDEKTDQKIADSKTRIKIKQFTAEKIAGWIKKGKIKTRDELVEMLKEGGIEVTRQGKDSISIKFPNQKKATKLEGPIFQKYAYYPDLLKQYEDRPKKTTLSPLDKIQLVNRLKQSVKYRAEFNAKRYAVKAKRLRTGFKPRNNAKTVSDIKVNQQQPKVQKPNVFQSDVAKKAIVDFTNKNRLKKPKVQKGSSSSNSGTKTPTSGVIQIKLSLGNIQAQINELASKIGSGVSIEEELRIKEQIAQLKLQEDKLAADLLKAEIEEFNQQYNPKPKLK